MQPLGLDGIQQDPYDAESDDEECDAGQANGNVDLVNGGCKVNCKLPECSNNRPQKGIPDGGTEFITDALADAADGGCRADMCNFDSAWTKGGDDESNPCQLAGPGAGNKQPGESCQGNGDCQPTAGPGIVMCLSSGSSYGTCTLMGAGPNANVADLLAAGGAGVNVPMCIPGVCGFVVGNEAACGGAFQAEGDTCDNHRARQQCLFNTAVALGQCPGGEIVPVPIGQEASCLSGQAPNQQKMCGPAGQWFCKCPGDNVQLWAENLVQCGPKCGDGNVDQGEQCDDGNQVNVDQCTNTCRQNVGGQCTGNECQDPAAAAACAAQNNAVCQADAQLPCIKCVAPVGGQCTGNECAQGGDAAAAAQGMECSLIPNLPCVTFIPPNSCGNGEIDPIPPQEVDEGCEVTGTSGQFCMPEGMIVDDFGVFQPSHQCFQTAHCAMGSGGQCEWEMTPDLEQCLDESAENGGGLPPGCFCDGAQLRAGCPVDFVRNPCVPLAPAPLGAIPGGNALTAQVAGDGDDMPAACTRDARICCENGRVRVVSRDQNNNCQFPDCNQDMTACRPPPQDRCVRGGCNGELCVEIYTTPPFQCEITQDAACYANANCAWTGTNCAWTDTPELQECLSDNADSTCPTDQSCLSRSACDDQGGAAGNACGAADTNVCCSGTVSDDPVEECDDGNRVDGDACSNDCQVNCRVNADCPEGACVNGQCVDQCADPAAPLAMHESADIIERAVEFLPRLMARGDFSLLP